MSDTPLDIERFQLAVVLSKTLLNHELLNVWVGLPAGQKQQLTFNCRLIFYAEERFPDTVFTVSPAAEVHLITPQVNVGIREHSADLLEEMAHEVIRGVQDGVHWSEGARGFGARVTGCEQIRLA